MAVFYVNTASTAGGDGTTNDTTGSTRAFASLQEAVDSLPSILTDATTIFCTGSAPDTLTVNQAHLDMVTSATNYLLIQGENRNGKWDTSKYRIELTNQNGIYNNTPGHFRIDALQVKITSTSSIGDNFTGIRVCSANVVYADVDCRVSNCIVWGVRVGTDNIDGYYPSPPTGSGAIRTWNCIAYGCVSGFGGDEGTITQYYNCTAYGNEFFGFSGGGALGVVNCLGAANGISDFDGTGSTGNSNNTSSDGTAPGTSSHTGQAFSFVNIGAGTEDFHLRSSDTGAKDFGLADPASGLYSDDIDGQTRSAPWDIGADEFIAIPAMGYIRPPRLGSATRPAAFKPGIGR